VLTTIIDIVFSRLAFSVNILLSGVNRVAIAILSEDVTAVLAERRTTLQYSMQLIPESRRFTLLDRIFVADTVRANKLRVTRVLRALPMLL
jgi:hypothetical protein